MRYLMLLGVVSLLLMAVVACSTSKSGSSRSQTENSGESVLPPATETPGGKVLPPLEVGLDVGGGELFVGRNFPLTLIFIPQENVRRATGQVEASGVVALSDTTELFWNDLGAGEEHSSELQFSIDGPGEGEIRALVQVFDETGEILYGRSASLYFLVTEEEVLTGTSSPLELKLRRLERDLESGAITEEQYQELLDEVLGGGATESNKPLQPMPTEGQ